MYTVYVICNQLERIYIGQTSDLKKRLAGHNGVLKNKQTSYTAKNKGYWTIIYQENLSTRTQAIKREKELKSYQGRLFIKNLIKK